MARNDHSRARHANALRRKKPTRPSYDRILVVCEGKKTEPNYNEQVVFKAIVSVPCFELWLLLHYVDIQAFHHRDVVLRRLREHIPNYEKGNDGLYTLTQGVLPIATKRAERLRARFSRLPGEEAYTDVDELVSILRSLTRMT